MASPKKPLAWWRRPADVWRRLYRGDTDFQFIPARKWWYLGSAVITLGAIVGIILSPFNWGIEFVGGNQFQASVVAGHSVADVEAAVEETGVEVASTQTAGTGDSARYIVRTADLSDEDRAGVQTAIADELGVSFDAISVSEVSSSWGASVSEQAVYALLVFLVLVCAYLWFHYDRAMSAASIIGLVQNLVFTAGIYAVIGFEVTPSTIIGLLTIKGYSLYDNVVVFDKVHENTRHVLSQRKFTYAEGTNRAINQTLMRSINTSIIGLLPVAGLLFVGAGILGVGTLTDLSLVLFVGIATGTLASLFLSSPLLVDFTMLNPTYRDHTRRVLDKRASGAGDDEDPAEVAKDIDAAVAEAEDEEFGEDEDEPETVTVSSGSSTRPSSPGNRPKRPAKRKRR